MARFWKLLSVLIFIGIFIFICLYHSISNTYFTLPKEENIQVKERNHGLFDTNTKVYAVNHKDEISKELNLLPNFEQRHSMMAFNITNLPDQTVIRNKTGKKKQSQTNVKSETPYILKLKKNNKAIGMNSDSSSNVHTETKTACRMSFDRETLYKARKKLLESKSYYLFHVHLKTDWLENDSSEHKDELMHWQYIVKDEQFLIQFPVDFDLLTYNMLVYDHEEKILEVKLLYNNSNCIEEDFEAKLRSVRRLLWENLLHNDTDHYLCNRNFQKETGRKWLYYLTTIWIGYDLNCSDISYKNYLDIITIEKDHLPLVAPMFCYLLSLQFVWIFVLLDIKKNSKAPKTDNESRTVTVKETIEADPLPTDKSLRGSTLKCIYDTGHETENVIFDHTDNCVITIADNSKMRVKNHMMTTIEMTPVHKENTYTTPMTNDDQMYTNNKRMSQNDQAHDSEVDKLVKVEIHGSNEKGKEKSNNKNTRSCKYFLAGKLKMSEGKDFKFVAKKEEKKNEIFQTQSGKADKDKAYMSGEENASEDDENILKIDIYDDDIYCYAKNERPYGIKRFFIKLLFDKCCCRNDCCCNNATVRLLFLLWLIILLFFGFYRTVGRFLLLKETYDDYLTVVLPSEPFFLILQNLEVKDINLYIVILDAIYAIGFPLIYIYFGCMSYQSFFKSEQRINSCISEDNDWQIITKDEVSYKFTIPFYKFCRTTKKLCFFKGCCSCDNCEDCMKISCECICNWLKYFVSLWIFLLFILCVFPIIPFSCNARICSCCDAEEDDSKMRKRWCGFCVHIGNFISFSIFYFLCLRPIISTFTFLFRSFTYFVFVALPIRIHILRYTLIVVTTVTYLAKYFHEIVNMNAEILDFIFICEKNRKRKKVKHVSEKLYGYIYGRVLFVQRKFFILFLKIIVVCMYLFITIETFITNQNSLTGTSFDKLLEFLFIIIGPYAISFFLKGDKNDFLTDENKQDLKELYERFYKKANETNSQSETRCADKVTSFFKNITKLAKRNKKTSMEEEKTPLLHESLTSSVI